MPPPHSRTALLTTGSLYPLHYTCPPLPSLPRTRQGPCTRLPPPLTAPSALHHTASSNPPKSLWQRRALIQTGNLRLRKTRGDPSPVPSPPHSPMAWHLPLSPWKQGSLLALGTAAHWRVRALQPSLMLLGRGQNSPPWHQPTSSASSPPIAHLSTLTSCGTSHGRETLSCGPWQHALPNR